MQYYQEQKEESEVGVVMYIYIVPSKRINNMISINQAFLDYSNVQKSFLCQYLEFAFERGCFLGEQQNDWTQ